MNQFNTVQVSVPNSNTFNLSHKKKLSTAMGLLTPVLLMDCIPGDVVNLRSEVVMRFMPMVTPVMHDIKVSVHYFAVPHRIVWPNWEDFISPDLSKTSPPAWPHIAYAAATQLAVGSLGDYFGLPTGVGNLGSVSCLAHASYNKIYNEYYRDQNMIPEVVDTLVNGSNNANAGPLNVVRRRAWGHDYFTSSLPFAQKGPAVSMPLISGNYDLPVSRNNAQGGPASWTVNNVAAPLTGPASVRNAVQSTGGSLAEGALYVRATDLNVTAATINDLRAAFKLQEFFEKAARGGTRYIEQMQMHFGVRSSDKRLQRPEFIGGTRNPVIISEVLQTSSPTATTGAGNTPLANMGGHGIAVNRGRGFRYYAEEHCYIIGIMSVIPDTGYQQGIPRHFLRDSWEKYAWPSFAHLGEQTVLNKELYVGSDGANDNVFGYIPRFSEYRFIPSSTHGEMRTSLNTWHLNRIFANRPLLNQTFIECTPDTDRIFAVGSTQAPQNLICHIDNVITVRRKLPKYGTPLL